jgi:endonuclease III
MKESKDYGQKIVKLFRTLKRGGGTYSMPHYADPVEAVIYGLLCEQMTEAAAARTYKRMKSHFVDLNDLRVCRIEEILEIFKDASPAGEKTARAITQALNTIFEKIDRVSLDMLVQEGKRQAHKELTEISGITPFAANYCFLTALSGHTIPLNAAMLEYLRKSGLVHPEATGDEIAGFLERQIAAKDAYLFYMLLRNQVERVDSEKPEKTDALAVAKKGTKKKTAVPTAAGKKAASVKKINKQK